MRKPERLSRVAAGRDGRGNRGRSTAGILPPAVC